MEQTTATLLAAWENFYVIIGSSAAALTGLQFVVVVLGAEINMVGTSSTTSAFSTPTIVHFCAALLISAILSAPWPTLVSAALGLGICGSAGIVYALFVIRHTRRQTDYKPVFEDWLWHGVLPIVAYVVLFVASITLWRAPVTSLFMVGGTTLLLLFIGIHNAWDGVTYVSFERRRRAQKPEEPAEDL